MAEAGPWDTRLPKRRSADQWVSVGIYTGIEQAKSSMLRRIHDWWIAHSHGDVPDRADWDPAEFKDLLPNILITDVETDPFRIRYRLVGTRVVDATGFNITGRYLDEMMPTEPEAPWEELYRLSYDRRRPVLGLSECTTTAGGLFAHEYGLFPLRRGGRDIVQFLSIEDYGDLRSTLTDLVEWREREAARRE